MVARLVLRMAIVFSLEKIIEFEQKVTKGRK